ncbi:MAG: hypothetical protein ACRET7_14495 [Burkholderiales bacterium]
MRRAAGGVCKALALLACVAGPWLAHLAMSEGVEGPLRLVLPVPHAAINLFLLWLFGRTLLQGREPLITTVARRVHGALAPDIEAYTRRVTLAWCCLFAAQILVSVLLFAFVPLEIWSLFVNVLSFPLVVLMFAGEYFYRMVHYPDHPRASIATALRAFTGQGSAATGAKAR